MVNHFVDWVIVSAAAAASLFADFVLPSSCPFSIVFVELTAVLLFQYESYCHSRHQHQHLYLMII
jgi:hypothetical protein